MTKRKRGTSPRLTIQITPDRWAKAKQANSAACLISDAARDAYPHLRQWSTDMATIRATDPEKGVRYHWVTPQSAQDLLLAFDQGWGEPKAHTVTLTRAFRITNVRRSGRWKDPAAREQRLADLERKEDRGTLTSHEKAALTRMRRNPNPNPPRSGGATEMTADGVALGGDPPSAGRKGKRNPNLLAGLTRAYGARRAQPAQAFRDAVEAEVNERLRQLTEARRPDPSS